MIAESQLCYSVCQDRVVPHYLGRGDVLWVGFLLEEYQRFVGRTRRELRERVRESLPMHVPRKESRVVFRLLDKLFPAIMRAPLPPKKIRSLVFLEAARARLQARDERASRAASSEELRARAAARAAEKLGLDASRLLDLLYADIPQEKRITAPERIPTPAELIDQANMLLAQGILARSQLVWVELDSQVRKIVRFASLLGLMCTVTSTPSHRSPCARSPSRPISLHGPSSDWAAPAHPSRRGVYLHVSGPLTLFRRTIKYGRSLARFLPALAWSPRWRLEAQCLLQGRLLKFRASHADGLLPLSEPPAPYDSKLEQRFAKDLAKAAPDWELLREPEPIRSRDTYIFPDFALVPRSDPTSRVLLEIVGFWTPDYLAKKIRRLRDANLSSLVLCVDDSLRCSDPTAAGFEDDRVVFFKRKIDPAAVLPVAKKILAEA